MRETISETIKSLYFFIIILISALPNGIFFGMPLKIILFVFLVLLFIYAFIKYEIRISKKLFLTSLFIFTFLTLYMVYGSLNFGFVAITEYRMIIITMIFSIIIYIFHTTLFSKKDFFYLYSWIVACIFLIKILAYLYGFLNEGRESSVEFYELYFNTRTISMNLPNGFYRLYLNTDMIAAFYPFVLAWAQKEKFELKRIIYYCLFFMSLVLVMSSFSRYLIVLFFIGLFLLIYYKKNFLQVVPIFLLASLFVVFVYYDAIIQFIELRVYSNQNEASDQIRAEQFDVLLNLFFNNNPFFGLGIGAYDPNYIRSSNNMFSYENQLLSFLPKIGVFGITTLLLMFSYWLYVFFWRKNLIGILAIILFILSGWFNPYLYSSNVAILYVFVLLMMHSHVKIQKV